jgi:pimeloyl-ACP methyl ester carboxylesterase
VAGLIETTAHVRGFPVDLVRSARTTGRPIVLLHGCGGSHRSLLPLAEALADLDVLLPALPGRAGSSGPPLSSVEDMAAWVIELVASTSASSFAVGGHSLGGAIALEVALRTKVDGVILLASGARLRVHPDTIAAMRRATETGVLADVSRTFHPETSPDVLAREAEARARTSPETTLSDWLACDGFDRLTEVSRIAAPVLAIAGADDPLTPPKYARFVAERVGRGSAAIVEGASHMLPVERPSEVASHVRAFVARELTAR